MIRKLRINLDFGEGKSTSVGEMLRTENGVIYFQFDPKFLQSQYSISPIKLKKFLEPQTPGPIEARIFDGLFGVFADSLPDGWGLMMMSRAMKRGGKDFASSTALDRLSYVGRRGMGSLIYEPESENQFEMEEAVELAKLAKESERVLEGKADGVLTELMMLGGSPGGARPKILVGVEAGKSANENPKIIAGVDNLPEGFEHWIIKFKGTGEDRDAGLLEYLYSQTAKHVGLPMPETRLFNDGKGGLWFGVKRFDRGINNSRVHLHSVAGLVHADFRLPSLDYEDILKITDAITMHEDDRLTAFRLCAFNVLFHNRDDHAKNFSFAMSKTGMWRLAPAYDLTYSPGAGGEHATAVLGEGKAPSVTHLLKLAERRGIDRMEAQRILQQVDAGRKFMIDLLKQYQVKNHPIKKHLELSKLV